VQRVLAGRLAFSPSLRLATGSLCGAASPATVVVCVALRLCLGWSVVTYAARFLRTLPAGKSHAVLTASDFPLAHSASPLLFSRHPSGLFLLFAQLARYACMDAGRLLPRCPAARCRSLLRSWLLCGPWHRALNGSPVALKFRGPLLWPGSPLPPDATRRLVLSACCPPCPPPSLTRWCAIFFGHFRFGPGFALAVGDRSVARGLRSPVFSVAPGPGGRDTAARATRRAACQAPVHPVCDPCPGCLARRARDCRARS